MDRSGKVRIVAIGAALSVAVCLAGCGGARSHESVFKDTLSILNEEADILETVRDQATAEAAVPKLRKLEERGQALQAEAEKVPKPSADVDKKLQQRYQGEMMSAMLRLQAQVTRIQREVGGDAWDKVNEAMSKGGMN